VASSNSSNSNWHGQLRMGAESLLVLRLAVVPARNPDHGSAPNSTAGKLRVGCAPDPAAAKGWIPVTGGNHCVAGIWPTRPAKQALQAVIWQAQDERPSRLDAGWDYHGLPGPPIEGCLSVPAIALAACWCSRAGRRGVTTSLHWMAGRGKRLIGQTCPGFEGDLPAMADQKQHRIRATRIQRQQQSESGQPSHLSQASRSSPGTPENEVIAEPSGERQNLKAS